MDHARSWPDLDHRINPRLLYLVLALAVTVPIAVLIYWPAHNGLDIRDHQIGRDFINVWAGPQLAFSGRIATLFDLEGYHRAIGELFGQPLPFHAWGYPLFALPAFWPLAQLPYFWALAVWTVSLFAVFAGVALWPLPPQQRLYGLAALLLAPASLINILGGQNGFLSAALLLGGILFLDRRPVLAGILFGLLTYKPHLGLVLPFILLTLGAWRVIAVATVTAMVLVAVSVVLFGVEPWRQYFDVTGGAHVVLLERFRGFFTFMMTSVVSSARLLGIPYQASLALQLAVAVPVVVASCWAVRRTVDPCRRAFVLASAVPLITPYAFNYDLPALAAVQVWMLCGRLPWHSRWSALYLLAWLIPTAMMYLNMIAVPVAPLVLLAMFVLAVREAASESAPVVWPSRPGAAPARAVSEY